SYAYWHNHFEDDPRAVGRTVQLNKRPFTIIGVAPREFHGSLLMFSPEFYVPIVAVSNDKDLNARGNQWLFEALGHLKAGVTPAQASADLNAIGSYLEKTYPKDDHQMSFTLARPNLYGDYGATPVRAFMAGGRLVASRV